MEVRFYSAFIVSVVGQNTWVDGEGFFRASVNSGAALYAVSVIDRVGNFLFIGKNSTMSPIRSAVFSRNGSGVVISYIPPLGAMWTP